MDGPNESGPRVAYTQQRSVVNLRICAVKCVALRCAVFEVENNAYEGVWQSPPHNVYCYL